LNAKVVHIDGTVTGDITGTDSVVVSKTGRVQGNIVAPRVSLEDGAQFKGSIDMNPGTQQVESKPQDAQLDNRQPAKTEAVA
jgi:cytoskeletal protein CcmA (bactofilin family)